MSAPPASPEYVAIQPAWRPITSTTITRSWLSAVVCRRSIASVAICTAVWNPNVKSVAERSLSIVFGTPTTRTPSSDELRARRRACPRRRSRSARRRGRASSVASTRARAVVGLVRDSCATCRGSCRRAAAARAPTSSESSHRLALDHARANRGGSRRSCGRTRPRPCGRPPGSPRSGPGSRRRRSASRCASTTSSSGGSCSILPRVRAPGSRMRCDRPRPDHATTEPNREPRRLPARATPAPIRRQPRPSARAARRKRGRPTSRSSRGPRGWVSRDGRLHTLFAARTLDFVGAHRRPPHAVLDRLLHPPAPPARVRRRRSIGSTVDRSPGGAGTRRLRIRTARPAARCSSSCGANASGTRRSRDAARRTRDPTPTADEPAT